MAAGMMMTALAATAGCAGMRDKMGMNSSDSMAMSGGMKMSEADKKMMASCMAMTPDQMMKNARCQEMAKMHPEMMKKDASNPM
jgi:hypothetical protein